jgi:hypothetical protein
LVYNFSPIAASGLAGLVAAGPAAMLEALKPKLAATKKAMKPDRKPFNLEI